MEQIIVVVFIVDTAVTRPDASLAFRRSSLCLFDRQGHCKIDEWHKVSLAWTTQGKRVQLKSVLSIRAYQWQVQLQTGAC